MTGNLALVVGFNMRKFLSLSKYYLGEIGPYILIIGYAAFVLFIFSTLPGCAISDKFGERVSAGSAKYSYIRTLTDGSKCQVDILSARDIIGGTLKINPDCSIESASQQTKGVEAALQAVNSALELAKTATSKVP